MSESKTTTLWSRPENGTYYFRKAVPGRLRSLVGKTMVQISLRTNDLKEAKARHAKVAAEVAAQWRAFEAQPGTLVDMIPATIERPLVTVSGKDAVALAGELYGRLLARHEDDPGRSDDWRDELRRTQIALPVKERQPDAPKWTFGGSFAVGQNAMIRYNGAVSALLDEKGISVSSSDRRRICSQVARAMAQAYEVLIRRASGDWSPDPRAGRFPPPVSFAGWKQWYMDYCIAKLPEPSSRKRQEGVLSAFFEYLGHDLPARVTADDAVRWMEKRLTEVSHATVRKADIAHPKSFFAWAKRTRRLASNPFAEVLVPRVGKKRSKDGAAEAVAGKREYYRGEAMTILEATLQAPETGATLHSRRAQRWVPWLCAYSGARVGEIAQLRKQDVYQSPSEDGSTMIWVIKITPEAGRVKDFDEREVAIHPHLLEQGFTDFVALSRTETLFYDRKRSRGGKKGNPQSAKVGERLARWVRQDLKITDPRISPNHAWRHRFRSLLKGSLVPEVLDGIDGHAPATEGHKYGKVWPEVSLAAVSLIEPYRFDGRELNGSWRTLLGFAQEANVAEAMTPEADDVRVPGSTVDDLLRNAG